MQSAKGHLRADTDPHQMLFEIHGLILSLHHDARFLKLPGALDRARLAFERMLAHHLSEPAAPRPPAARKPATGRPGSPKKPSRAAGARTGIGRARR